MKREIDDILTNPASELCFLSGNQKREIVKLVNKAKQEERERIIKALPDYYGWQNIVGSAPQENAQEVGFDICLKQVKDILKELK